MRSLSEGDSRRSPSCAPALNAVLGLDELGEGLLREILSGVVLDEAPKNRWI